MRTLRFFAKYREGVEPPGRQWLPCLGLIGRPCTPCSFAGTRCSHVLGIRRKGSGKISPEILGMRDSRPADTMMDTHTTKRSEAELPRPNPTSAAASTSTVGTHTVISANHSLEQSIADVRRHRNSLWRQIGSAVAFLKGVQPEVRPVGGRDVANLPDLLKKIIEEVEGLREIAGQLLNEIH